MRYFVNQESTVLRVAVGDEIIVRLRELAAAGYEWHGPTKISAGLEVFAVQPCVASASEGAVGGKSLHEFGLHVRAHGWYVLVFQCYRSWEGPSSSIETYTLEVNAQP